jgi:hypothetical protein
MVATERMKLAETEEELKEAQAEKEALRSALRLVEHQRSQANSREASVEPPAGRSRPSSFVHAHKRSTSSAIAIKSLPSSPQSFIRVLESSPSLRAAAPPPLNLPEVGLANADVEVPSLEAEKESPPPVTASDANSSMVPAPDTTVSEDSIKSSPTPSPGQFAFSSNRPVAYFDGEESPWADVKSSTPISAAF